MLQEEGCTVKAHIFHSALQLVFKFWAVKCEQIDGYKHWHIFLKNQFEKVLISHFSWSHGLEGRMWCLRASCSTYMRPTPQNTEENERMDPSCWRSLRNSFLPALNHSPALGYYSRQTHFYHPVFWRVSITAFSLYPK